MKMNLTWSDRFIEGTETQRALQGDGREDFFQFLHFLENRSNFSPCPRVSVLKNVRAVP
jgi:hypothetical protein